MGYTQAELAILKRTLSDIIKKIDAVKNQRDRLLFGQANHTSSASEILKNIDNDFEEYQRNGVELERQEYFKATLKNAAEMYQRNLDETAMRNLNELRRANKGASFTKEGFYIGH